MKILIICAGVIGTTYGWQLSNAGHDVTLFVRKTKLESVQTEGIRIRCKDERQIKSLANTMVYFLKATSRREDARI